MRELSDLNDGHDDEGLVRGLRVLEILAGMEQPAGLMEIAGRAHLSKSKTYRTLRSLQSLDFVHHVGRSGYRLGVRSLALASLLGARPTVQQICRPALTKLVGLSSAASVLNLRSGAHRVIVLALAPRGHFPPQLVLGERAPLISGCAGTAILAFLPDAEAQSVITARPPGYLPPDPAEIAQIRQRGYAISISGNHANFNGVGAPLLDGDGYAIGSVVVCGSSDQLDKATLSGLSKPLTAVCGELAPRLAKLIGRDSSERLATLDVTIQGLEEI